ncbi:hypothetical protein CLU96_3096 [Chryseobacterium sp. 52]|uniref:hypothetical protein n=1 Tax=Chryseobacterium sp. 52 TaxID=2035213 RepID=UPI000C18EAB5|nr:hypothetical protein [Chryseobacterium sp. 52]PIF46078.1 hypothetical protein CLU96_3096 [Chryseobacterium sp. 52]
MKRVTLIAIISLCVIIATYFAEIIIGFLNLNDIMTFYRFFGAVNLLGYIGLLPFFIKLYQKQR